jgi:hypothetical protein
MRLLDDEQERSIRRAWIYLTEGEAEQLMAHLQARRDEPDPDWHARLEAEEGDGIALTVAIYDPEALPADETVASFLEVREWPTP